MPSAEVLRHFDGVAGGYSAFRNKWPLSVVRRQERQAISELVHLREADRVLDAGCGDGELLSWLEKAGTRPIGIDISRSMATQCRRRGFLVSVQDLENPAFGPIFDWVLCFGALEFTSEPPRALAALAAALRPGGRLVLLFPKHGWLGRLYATYHRGAHGVSVHLFRRSDVTEWMRRAGLTQPEAWRDLSLSALCVAQLE